MMQASPYPAQPGMGPGHPVAHGHPMQMQHGGHMGQPNAAMMNQMHAGMHGPQVTQGGPMVSGMPPNPGTPAPGNNPMQNAMAMAHLNGQGPMFHGQNPQMGMNMQMQNANLIARQRAMNNMMQAQGGQMGHNMMNQINMAQLNPQQQQQMLKMNMPLHQMQHLQQMTPAQQAQMQQQQQYQHQQRMMAQHVAAQQHVIAQQRQQAQQQQAQQQQQQHASQQMQMSRSQEPVTQPPQPQPTPAPQQQPTPQAQAQAAVQVQQPTPQQKPPQAPPPTSQPQTTSAPTPQIKQADPVEDDAKPDISKQQILLDEMRSSTQDFSGQCILQLLSFYDTLAGPARPHDIEYWQDVMSKYFSTAGSLRHQVWNATTASDKSFQLHYPTLARFYHSHFTKGVKQIYMQSFDHTQEALPNGGYHVRSQKMFLTYVYEGGIKVTAQGNLGVNFDDMMKIENLHIQTRSWQEMIPRQLVSLPVSPEQNRQSPKMNKKNLPKNQQRPTMNIPKSPVCEYGIPAELLQYLEIAEVMTTMEPLMSYYLGHPVSGPREALSRYNAENAQNMNRMQNMNAAMANGQLQMPNQRMAGMNPPNQFQSPAFSHLGLPQNQQSPHMNHTPSPGHAAQGGIQMVHQMSQPGSNPSGSQGPSTNTSPNVTNKRRRASAIKEEDAQAAAAVDGKTKPSPRVGKRQKGAPA